MSIVENKCSGCEQNCCVHFKITREVTDPWGLKKELAAFPYIKQVSSELIMGPGGHEKVVGIYSCGRFNTTTSECLDYSTKPRPDFCINTGITSTPNVDCKLGKLHKS